VPEGVGRTLKDPSQPLEHSSKLIPIDKEEQGTNSHSNLVQLIIWNSNSFGLQIDGRGCLWRQGVSENRHLYL
jgi:hypothetical protein